MGMRSEFGPAVDLAGLLGLKPLTWIGLRSYGIYLWHWPIFTVTRPSIDVSIDGWQLFALRFAAVLLLAELSFRFVEMPIRRAGFAPVWRRLRSLAATRLAVQSDNLARNAAERLPSNSGSGLQAQPVPAPVLIDTSPAHGLGRRSRAQRHSCSNHARKRHHRRPAI